MKLPSNSSLSTSISNDLAYAKNPTINWHGILLGPTARKPHNKRRIREILQVIYSLRSQLNIVYPYNACLKAKILDIPRWIFTLFMTL